jgi:hypothetical protein
LKKITNQNAVIIGTFTALAHFSHSIGVLPGIAISIYFLLRKQFRATLLLISTWIIILTPWMIRNYLVFGDALQGTGIPIPRNIAMSIGLISKDAPNLNITELGPLGGISISNTIKGMVGEFSNIYGMQFFLIFISFSIFAYICFVSLKAASQPKRILALILSGILSYGLLISYVIFIGSDDENIYVQLLVLFILPIIGFIYVKGVSRYKNIFTTGGKDVYLLIAIFTILSFIPYFMYAQYTGRVTPEVRIIIHSLYLLIPLSVFGIWQLCNTVLTEFKIKDSRFISVLSTALIVISLAGVTYITGINSIITFQERFEEDEFQTEMNSWIKTNIPPEAKIATDLPHVILLRTGHEAVNLLHNYKDIIPYEKWVIKKFDIDYLVFYFFKDNVPGKTLSIRDLGEVKLKLVYQGDKGGLVYKVIEAA